MPPVVPKKAKRQPPPLPKRRPIKEVRRPEFDLWLAHQEEYSQFIKTTCAAIYEFMELQSKLKEEHFIDQDVLRGTTFYVDLIKSASTLFQQGLIIHSILSNNSKYRVFKLFIVEKISLNTAVKDDKLFFANLKRLAPQKVHSFLIALKKIVNTDDPKAFHGRVVKQLKLLDPTQENKLLIQLKL